MTQEPVVGVVVAGDGEHGTGHGGERAAAGDQGECVGAAGLAEVRETDYGAAGVVCHAHQRFQRAAELAVLVGVDRVRDRGQQRVEHDHADALCGDHFAERLAVERQGQAEVEVTNGDVHPEHSVQVRARSGQPGHDRVRPRVLGGCVDHRTRPPVQGAGQRPVRHLRGQPARELRLADALPTGHQRERSAGNPLLPSPANRAHADARSRGEPDLPTDLVLSIMDVDWIAHASPSHQPSRRLAVSCARRTSVVACCR